MARKLPDGWVKTSLGEIMEPSRGRALPAQFPDIPYVGLEHIEPQTMKLLGHVYARNYRSSSARFSKGDVLYGKMRPYLNKVWVAEFDGLCSTEFLILPRSDVLNSHFLAFRLNAEDFVAFSNAQVSGERPRVNFKKLSSFSILLPPTGEQSRIVSKLNAALARVTNGVNAANHALQKLEDHRAAILLAAVSGELTSDWRKAQQKKKKAKIETGDILLQHIMTDRRNRWEETELDRLSALGKGPKDDKWKARYHEPVAQVIKGLTKLPSTWCSASVDQISTRVTVGYVGTMKSQYVPEGVPFLRSQNVRPNRFEPAGLLFISREFHARIAKSKIAPGDVVVVRSGLVGTTCVIPDTIEEANCSDLVLIQKPLIQPHFISFYMNSAAQRYIKAGKVGIALSHFNTSSVAALPIPLPPAAEQAEIVRQVESLLSRDDRLAISLKKQIVLSQDTRQSLLNEAFEGLLVPQKPNDEPASVLLDRIHKERAEGITQQKESRVI